MAGRQDSQVLEDRRMTADAIILERAIRVLERRYPDDAGVPLIRAGLSARAASLRSAAGHDAPARQ
jgi:hypothetical protein